MRKTLFTIILICSACGSFGRNEQIANEELGKWAEELGIPLAHKQCNSVDSDNDGYVSCTYTVVGKEDQPQQIECAAAFNLQHGCRLPKPTMRTTVVNNGSSN